VWPRAVRFLLYLESAKKVGAGEPSLLILLVLCLWGAEKPLKNIGLYAAGGFRIECLRRVLLILQQLPGQTTDFLVDSGNVSRVQLRFDRASLT